jgi:hypothetical protein
MQNAGRRQLISSATVRRTVAILSIVVSKFDFKRNQLARLLHFVRVGLRLVDIRSARETGRT